MIHILEIEVPHRSRFGDVITKDIMLPSKIRRINGVVANAILGDDTFLENKQYVLEMGGGYQSYNDGASTTIIGSFSLCVNNTGIVIANAPITPLNELHNSSYRHNLSVVEEGLLLRNGSMARIVLEERAVSPFVDDEKIDATAAEFMQNWAWALSHTQEQTKTFLKSVYGSDKFTNDYKVKIYIDYDK